MSIFTADDRLLSDRHGQLLIADKNYYGHQFEHELDQAGLRLLRPTRKGERHARSGERFFKPLRQTVESIFDTAKGQLDLEDHGGHTITGIAVRVYSAPARPDRGDLAQRQHRPTRQTIATYDH